MNEISKSRLALAKKNLERFKSPDLLASMVTGSVAKGCADEHSDIDTLLIYKESLSASEFERIIKEAKESGGDFYHGTPEEGFAVYYYFEGVKCDFGFGNYRETEKLISEMLENPEVDLIKHLQIAGFLEGIALCGDDWIKKWKEKALQYPEELGVMLVKHFLKFHPRWVMDKMAVDRNDALFYHESLLEVIGNIIGILCGLNKIYHPGKLKGVEHTIESMKIKPDNFIDRYRNVFKLQGEDAVNELYDLIGETIALIDKHLPEVSTKRTREIQKMILRK